MAMIGRGGNPPMRADQVANLPQTRAGSGPAPQNAFVIAQRVVVFGTGPGRGIFVYSPVPGLGNLIASVAAQGGTDPYGNTYYGGVSVYDGAGNVVELAAGTAFFFNQVSGAWFATISPQGELIYGGPPAAGNLVASVTPAAGTDSHGNAFKKIFTTYGAGGSYVNIHDNEVDIGASAADAFPADLKGGGGNLLAQSGKGNAGDTPMGVTLLSALLSVSGNNPQACLAAGVPNPVTGALLEVQGQAVVNLGVRAKDPAAAAAETEHAFSFNAGNGWTADATRSACQYFLAAAPGASKLSVLVMGSVVVPAGFAVGQAITNAAAAAYRPVNTTSLTGHDVTAAPNGPVRLVWTAGGILQYSSAEGTAVAAGHTIDIPPQLVYLAN